MRHIKKDTVIKLVFVIASVCLIFAIGLVVGSKLMDKRYNTPTSEMQSQSTTVSGTTEDLYSDDIQGAITLFDGEPYALKADIETILFIGVDASEERELEDEENDQRTYNQSDVVMLFVIDHEKQSYSLIQLDRDTMADIIIAENQDGYVMGYRQLALSFTYGTDMEDCAEHTMYAVSHLMHDITIDHYIAITMDSIPILNDQVGGVTVTIPEDMTMDDPDLIEGETVTLNGEQADTFVRARQELEDPTNINRMSRQRTYMSAWRSQAITRINEDSNFAIDLVLALSNYLYSDMDASRLSSFANLLTDYTDNGIVTIEGQSVQGSQHMEFYVDEDALISVIRDEFYYKVEG